MDALTPETADNLIHRVNVGDSLTRSAARHPGNLAVVDGDRRSTYAELNSWVNRVANALARDGYARGDALALASGNSVEFLVVYYACAKLGVVCVPVNLGWQATEVAYVLGHSEARGIAIETQLLDTMADAVAEAPAVADVLVLPGTGAATTASYNGRRVRTLDKLTHGIPDDEPRAFVCDRDPGPRQERVSAGEE